MYDSLALHAEFDGVRDRTISVDVLFLTRGTLELNASSDQEHTLSHGSGHSTMMYQSSVSFLRIEALGPGLEPLGDVRVYPTVKENVPLKDRLLHIRKLSQPHADLSLATQWLTMCQNDHDSSCQTQTWHHMGDAGLRLIDVQSCCIIAVQEVVKYVALSYCWGQVNDCLQLTRSNRSELETKNSLYDQRSDLPQTIRDAIYLTRRLEQRYLWVDALCICQDDGNNKTAQILQMDKIYRHAECTIVAAAGSDSWSGLSRLRKAPQKVRSIIRTIQGIDLTCSYPQQESSYALAESVWASRAWTFQEHLLSSRLLIFGQHEMTWECECSRYAESVYLESEDKDILVKLRSTMDYATKQTTSMSPFQRYNFFVERITRRRLGNERDRLNCMQGIMNVLEADFPTGFYWGLPKATFDSSLLFSAGPFDEAPLIRNESFPSWCWAGWTEEADEQITSPYDRYPAGVDANPLGFFSDRSTRDPSWLRKEVAWFHVEEKQACFVPIHSALISEQGSLFYRESLDKWNQMSPERLLKTTKENFGRAGVPVSHALVGWTQVVYLEVDRQRAKVEEEDWVGMHDLNQNYGNGFAIRTPSGRVVGYINLFDDHRKTQPDLLCFILMSQHRRLEARLGPLFDMLHVEERSGVAFRVQGVRDCTLDQPTWDTLDTSWKLVMMG